MRCKSKIRLKEFYENIKSKLVTANIHVSNITHKQYHEIYEFKKDGLVATYKFWYDGKSIFRNTEIIPTQTTGLTDDINGEYYLQVKKCEMQVAIENLIIAGNKKSHRQDIF